MPPPKGTWNPIEGPGDYTTTKEVHNDTYPAIDPLGTDMKGKSVFICGASRGIGKAIALAFARSGTSQIAVGARSDLSGVATELREAAANAGRAEPTVLSVQINVSDVGSVDAGIKKIGETFGKLDAVVHNAGVLGERNLVADSDPEGWWDTLTINLKGPYLIGRACIRLLLRGETKTIIAVSSVGSLCVSPTLSAYQTSKLAVNRLMEFIGAEYAEQGIVAMSVHPGNVLTDIVGNGEGMEPKMLALFTETPQLCGDTLAFLSRERRGWLNGRYINCTWDMAELTSPEKQKVIEDGDLLRMRLTVP